MQARFARAGRLGDSFCRAFVPQGCAHWSANHLWFLTMSSAAIRIPRERTSKAASRIAILDAARRVAARDGARDLSLRGVAAEAGFAPAALYGYFRNKDELLLALA